MSDDVRPWEPESLSRLRRERAPLVRKRDELQADVDGYNGAIKRLDERIGQEERRMNGEASGDG